MIKINCDIGEREPDNKVDIELMKYIQIANIACGGHAGNEETVSVFRKLARENDVEVAAHLSYPDRENFGRVSIDISVKALKGSLDEQYNMMPDVKMVKFHGGLYNDCCADPILAEHLCQWLIANEIEKIITPDKSELAKAGIAKGLKIVPEAFAERRYDYNPETQRLSLVNRKKAYACIHDCDEAVEHSDNILSKGFLIAIIELEDGTTTTERINISAETICIHSDSEIALELAQRLSTRDRRSETKGQKPMTNNQKRTTN